jgi:hypothetical protein
MLVTRGATVAGGGVIPHIHRALLHKEQQGLGFVEKHK